LGCRLSRQNTKTGGFGFSSLRWRGVAGYLLTKRIEVSLTDAKIDNDDGGRFRVSGDMTFATTRKLLAESRELFDEAKNLKLNLKDVQHADSSGLALLLEWIAEARQRGGKVSIEGIPESLLAIAKLCQMDATLKSLSEKDVGEVK
jgi:phospholipid transport system transporter-binding protein